MLFVGLGGDFGIHFCMSYPSSSRRAAPARRRSWRRRLDVGSSLVLTAATTAIGFFAFLPTEFIGVAELGLISGADGPERLLTLTLPAGADGPGAAARPRRRSLRAIWTTRDFELPVRYPRVCVSRRWRWRRHRPRAAEPASTTTP